MYMCLYMCIYICIYRDIAVCICAEPSIPSELRLVRVAGVGSNMQSMLGIVGPHWRWTQGSLSRDHIVAL